MKLAEILSGPDTWCQRQFHRGANQSCLMGALMRLSLAEVAEGRPEDPLGLDARLTRVLGTRHIIQWNDTYGRTWDEVAAVVEAFDRDRLLNP